MERPNDLDNYSPERVEIPSGPATPQEIWDETIALLEQSPGAYVHSVPTVRRYGERVLDSLWEFKDLGANEKWTYVGVTGTVALLDGNIVSTDHDRFAEDEEVMRAVMHINTTNRQLTPKEWRKGLLGVSTLPVVGRFLRPPERVLRRALAEALPSRILQLTVQARANVIHEDTLDTSLENIVTLAPRPDGGIHAAFNGNHVSPRYDALFEINGQLERLLPSFNRGKLPTLVKEK